MTMADPRPEILIVNFPLRRCDDRELTCFICNSREPCDYETTHRGPGRFVTIGAHLACVQRLRAPRLGDPVPVS